MFMKVCPVFNKIKAKLFALDKGENGMSQITKRKIMYLEYFFCMDPNSELDFISITLM